MKENPRGEQRENQAENTSSIEFAGRHVRVQNGLSIDEYISRVQHSVGEIHVVEAEEFLEDIKQEEDSIVAVFTDGYIIGSDKDTFLFGSENNGIKQQPTYISWVTTSFNREKNVFDDKPFSYHLVTKEHTREDVAAIVKKTGTKLTII